MSNWALACFWIAAFFIIANFVFSIAVTIGGFFDLLHLVRQLKESKINETDNGRAISQ